MRVALDLEPMNIRSALDVLFERCASSVVWFTATVLAVALILFGVGFVVIALLVR